MDFEILFPKVYTVTSCCFGGKSAGQGTIRLLIVLQDPTSTNCMLRRLIAAQTMVQHISKVCVSVEHLMVISWPYSAISVLWRPVRCRPSWQVQGAPTT